MENITKQLRRGDNQVIARLAGVSVSLVKKVLAAEPVRENKRVMVAAERLVKARQQTEAQIAREVRTVKRK